MRSRSWNLHDLPGMERQFEQQLAHIGIQTTAQLLQKGRTVQAKHLLAQQLQLPLRYINKWVALADLARVPSVGCQYSGLLLHAGVISVSQLAQSTRGTLHSQLRRLHVTTLTRVDLCPDPSQVSRWIDEARAVGRL
jgi:Domain of unknown function (DUF4332)